MDRVQKAGSCAGVQVLGGSRSNAGFVAAPSTNRGASNTPPSGPRYQLQVGSLAVAPGVPTTPGVPTAGVPTAGVPMAGMPMAGVPTAGVPLP
jgi:hypothetical protein